MATLNRRANSLPARAAGLATGSESDLGMLQAEVEAKIATSPSIMDSRSPPTVATFSPVFDLELGGSCTSTPQDRRYQGGSSTAAAQIGGNTVSLPSTSRRWVTSAFDPILFRPLLPAPAGATPQKMPNLHLQQKYPNTSSAICAGAMGASSAGLDRSASDLQVIWARRNASGAAGGTHAGSDPPVLSPEERLESLCRPSSALEVELAKQLRAFRAARIVASPSGGAPQPPPPQPSTPPPLDYHQQQQPTSSGLYSGAGNGGNGGGAGSPSGPTPGEIEALASELQSAGFLVQILDGTRLSKDARACLRTLKHRFLVCMGRVVTSAPPSRRLVHPGEQESEAHVAPGQTLAGTVAGAVHGFGDCIGNQQQQQQQQQMQGPWEERLSEPLVVEVRFREQFLVACPTQAYQLLLLALPLVFVGPLRRLEAVVDFMAAEVAAVFKAAKRPLPPWRTKGAMLSKWAPAQLGELGRRMRCAAASTTSTNTNTNTLNTTLVQSQSLFGRQKQVDCDKSWGSAMGMNGGSGFAQRATTTTSAMVLGNTTWASSRDPLSEPLHPAPYGILEPRFWPSSSKKTDVIAEVEAEGGAAAAAAAAVTDGGYDVADDESKLEPRSNSEPPHTATEAGPGAAGEDGGGCEGATEVSGDDGRGAGSSVRDLVWSESALGVINLSTLDNLMVERIGTFASISQVETSGEGAVVIAGRPSDWSAAAGAVMSTVTADEEKQDVVMMEPLAGYATGRALAGGLHLQDLTSEVEISFPILPEIVPVADAVQAMTAWRPTGQEAQRERHEDGGEIMAAVEAPLPLLPQPLPLPLPLVERGETVATRTAAAIATGAAPLFRAHKGLSALSPFASISLPEECDARQDSSGHDCGGGGVRPAAWSARLPCVRKDGYGSSIGNAVPEFTFKNTALDSDDPELGADVDLDLDFDLGLRDAPGSGVGSGGSGSGGACGGGGSGGSGSGIACGGGDGGGRGGSSITLPPPPRVAAFCEPTETPPAPAAMAAAAAAVAAEAGHGNASLSPFTSGTAVRGLDLAHQPLANGVLGIGFYGGGVVAAGPIAAAATAAPRQLPRPPPLPQRTAADSSGRLPPAASHPPAGGGYPNDLMHIANSLNITRRSSSDLHRAAEKFKKAKSLLATAIRLAKGGGSSNNNSGGGSTAAATASGSGFDHSDHHHHHHQQQTEQLNSGASRNAKAVGAATATATATTAAAVVVTPVGAGAASRRSGGGGGAGGAGGTAIQVSLPGGVMTQPSSDEPRWARGIRTVKWNQSTAPVQTAAAAAAAALPSTTVAAAAAVLGVGRGGHVV